MWERIKNYASWSRPDERPGKDRRKCNDSYNDIICCRRHGNIRMVNAGGYKVTALAPGADGRTVASVGTVKGVTKYAFVLLISVNEDGTTEIVEGTVDPVTLQVMGAFKGTPRTITVSVVMAK